MLAKIYIFLPIGSYASDKMKPKTVFFLRHQVLLNFLSSNEGQVFFVIISFLLFYDDKMLMFWFDENICEIILSMC